MKIGKNTKNVPKSVSGGSPKDCSQGSVSSSGPGSGKSPDRTKNVPAKGGSVQITRTDDAVKKIITPALKATKGRIGK